MKFDILGRKSIIQSHLPTFFSHIVISGLVLCLLFSQAVGSVHAWWFTESAAETAVAPVHTRGLVLSPLVQKIIPEFILEPLTETEKEAPPSIEKDLANTVVLTPVHRPADDQSTQYSAVAEQMLKAVNDERGKLGLVALTLNNELMNSAQAYASRMQREDFFQHISPDGSTMRQRNEAAGYVNWQWMGENLGMGQQSVGEVIEDWMNSEGHRANILEPRARELGVGYVGGNTSYWVQEFGVQF